VSAPPKGGGVHRLIDIEVEEVSLVDRAANKHRFLIVKREDGVFDNDDDDEQTEKASDPTTAAAIAALEGLISIMELLTSAGADDPRIAELATELRTTAEQLGGAPTDAEKARKKPAAGGGPEGAPDDDDEPEEGKPGKGEPVDGDATTDGKKKPAKKNTAAVEASIASAKALLGKLAALKRTTKASPAPPPITSAELSKLTEAIGALNSSMQEQQKRLGHVEKHVGLPNSAPPAERVTKNEPAEASWPLDLNRPKGRENVDKTLSFHDL